MTEVSSEIMDDFRHTTAENQYLYTRDNFRPFSGAFASTLLHYSYEEPYQSVIAQSLERDEVDSQHAFNLVLRGMQHNILRHSKQKHSYPHGFDNEDAWAYEFEYIARTKYRMNLFKTDVLKRTVQSNVPERYKTVKLLGSLMADRFDEPPTVLDIGSSVMHGTKKLIYSSQLSELNFKPIEIVKRGASSPDMRQLGRLALKTNALLETPQKFGKVAAMDITNINRPGIRDWIRACSFYPEELIDPRNIEQYDLLELFDPSNERISFTRADFSSTYEIEKFRETLEKPFDIITFSTVLYQVPDQKRIKMMKNAEKLISDKGIIINQDAPNGNFAKPFNYFAEARDFSLHNGREGFQPLLRWDSGRCAKAVILDGALNVRDRKSDLKTAIDTTEL